MSAKKPWTVQWHVAADGTVFKQRSRGDQEHQQLFQTYETHSSVAVEDLDAMDERLKKSTSLFFSLTMVLVVVAGIAAVSLVLSLFLPWLGVSENAAGVVLIGSVVGLVLAVTIAGGVIGWSMSHHQRIYKDTGLASPNGVTLPAREARAMVADPRTSSGRKVASVRG